MSALSWQSLRVDYDGKTALDLGPVDLSGGQLIALLGPNGSGKSTLFKALIGAIPTSSDALKLGGEMIDQLSRHARARRLAYLSQARTGPALATVQDIVALGRTPHGGADPEGRVDTIIQRCDLHPLASRRFGTLSGGEQARVLLARTLAVGGEIILVDEPTAALDPYYALSLMETLRHETKQGALVIVSLHTLDLAQRYADQIIVLNDGKIAAQGPSKDALNPTILKDVFRVHQTKDGLRPIGS